MRFTQLQSTVRTHMRLGKPVLFSFAAVLTLPFLGAGQNPSAPAAPTLKVYSRETIVDITVTDSKGNPVHGLTQADFTVKEDNKPQPIRSFEEFSAHTSDDLTQPHLPPNTYTNRQPPPAGDAVNVFLLDFLNSAPDVPPDVNQGPGLIMLGGVDGLTTLGTVLEWQHLMKVDSIKYLQSMPTGTRIALLGMFQPGSLHILQGVTTDPALLSASIDATQYGTQSIANNHESWCAQQEGRNRSTLESFNQIAADLAAIKGRKNLIWFTVGLATITDAAQRPSCLTDYSKDLQKAYSLLAAAQVAVFPVSVRGVGLLSPAELSMESVAEATGGEAYYNSNDLAGLVAHAVDKGANYYTVSYVPPGQKFDYSHHTINIAVDKPDLHLVYRQGYDAVDPATIKPIPGLSLAPSETNSGNSHVDIEAGMHAAMGRAMPTSTQLIFNVYVEPAPASPSGASPTILGTLDPKLKGKPLTRYSFLYNMPASRLAFSSDPDGSHHGSLELDLAAYDTDGKLVTGLSQTVAMPLTGAQFQSFTHGPFHFLQQLDLPSGQLFLRIGILDRTSNKVGTLEIPLTVPKNPAPR
jgi:VWFA-related protein